MHKLITGLSATIILTACASSPDSIDAAYVSPLKYQSYECDQLALELDYVSQRTTVLYQNLKDKRNADNWQMGVGLVLFWPALFALEGGDGADAAEYSQLKGEFEALRQASTSKRCGLAMRSPDEILNAAAEGDNTESQTQEVPRSSYQIGERLEELDDLHERGVITDDEYNAARSRALGL